MDTPVGRERHVGERSAHLVREGGEPGWLGAELVGDSAPLQPRAFGAVISKRRLQRQKRCASTRQPNEADATPCIVRTPEAQAPQACVSTVPPKARSAQRSRICTIREKHSEISRMEDQVGLERTKLRRGLSSRSRSENPESILRNVRGPMDLRIMARPLRVAPEGQMDSGTINRGHRGGMSRRSRTI